MKNVKQILDQKGREVWTIDPDESVFEALKVMSDKEVGALVVVQSAKILGILSERDYARKVVLKGVSSRDTPVREIMVEKVVYIRPDQTAEECLALMTDKRCRHLPVVEDESLGGIVSIGDAVKAIIADREFMIEQLENYIRGG